MIRKVRDPGMGEGKITCIILTVCIEGEGGDFWYHIMKDELHMIRDDNLFDNGPGVEAKF